jgi:hypothetical protein
MSAETIVAIVFLAIVALASLAACIFLIVWVYRKATRGENLFPEEEAE